MTEIWAPIEDWPDYAVSNMGRVKRTTSYGRGKAGTIRKPIIVSGYHAVTLTNRDGRRKLLLIHLLVAKAFLGPPPEPGMEINHIDANRENPALSNLEWMTKSQNRKHGYDVGFASAKGERNGYSKLTDDIVRMIRREGHDRSTWPSMAANLGISKGTVRDVVTRRTWKHVTDEEAA